MQLSQSLHLAFACDTSCLSFEAALLHTMSTRALGCRPVGQAVGTSQSYYSTNGGFQAGHTCLRRKRRQHQGSGRDVHMQAKAERRLQRIENRWPSLKQVKLCPRPTNARRAYASAASDASASTSTFHSAAPVTGLSEVNSQKGDGITSDKSLAPLEAQAQDLLSLLIDGTGRNPGKQRQISWADREGGAEEEEEWMKRLDWAAKQGLPSRNTVVAGAFKRARPPRIIRD